MPDAFSIDAFLKLGDNRVYLDRLVDQVRAPIGVIPFVGAGMSVPFGFKQWGDFLREQAPDEPTRERVRSLLTDGLYEEAAEAVLNARGANAFQATFEESFGVKALGNPESFGAVGYLPALSSGPVFTTNFDRVLEAAFERAGDGFIDTVQGPRVDSIRKASSGSLRVLIKLHGDADDRANRILTKSDYDRWYDERTLGDILALVFRLPCLFLGCSLKKDRTVERLKAFVRQFGNTAEHYTLAEIPADEGEFAKRRKELSDLCVLPIWYPTRQHAWIGPILAELVRRKAEPAALRPGVSRPRHNEVPQPLSELIGRDWHMHETLGALKASRIVSVQGPEGVGKTALLLNLLKHLRTRDTFGGLVWSSAREPTLDLAELLGRLSRTLDFPYTPERDLKEKERLVREDLVRLKIRCLLVVDNFELLTDAGLREFLFDRLPEQCTALIASSSAPERAPAHLRVVELQPLDGQPAAALLARLAKDKGVALPGPQMVERLCATLGGLPLAIEFAAEQMRQGSQADWIIDEVGRGDSPLFSLLARSWRDLDGPARRVLVAASLFPATFDGAALQAAAGIEVGPYRRAVGELVTRYLLRRVRIQAADAERGDAEPVEVSEQYVLQSLTRNHVRLQPDARDPAFLTRAAEHFVGLLRAHGAGTPDKESTEDLRALGAQRVNILAMMDACRDAKLTAQQVRLGAESARWLFIDGRWSDLETRGAEAAIAAEGAGDKAAAACIKAEVGRVYAQQSRTTKADAAFGEAMALAAGAGDRRCVAYIKHHMAESLIRREQFDRAGALLKESLSEFTALGERREMIGVRYRTAVLRYERAVHEKDAAGLAAAAELFEAGIADCRDEGWNRLEAYHHNYLGDIAVHQNNPERARLDYGRAQRLTPPTDSRRLALLELSWARLEDRSGNAEAAATLAEAARGHLRKLGMRLEEDEAEAILQRRGVTSSRR